MAKLIQIRAQMKNRSSTQSVNTNGLKLQINWQTLTNLETSLRKCVAPQSTVPIAHNQIEILATYCKRLIKTAETLKSQQKNYASIQQSYNAIQSKLANHDNIVNNLEKSHLERLKSISDEIRLNKEYYEKAKKSLQESEETARREAQEMRKQNTELKYKVEILMREKSDLQKLVEEKDKMIQELQQKELRFKNVAADYQEKPPVYKLAIQGNSVSVNNLQNILCSSLCSRLIAYLPPKDIITLEQLNKQCQIYITKSKKCQKSLSKSIINTKNRVIKYYHKHINYFEKLYHKIPQEILQIAFYRYEIVKENIGTEILAILNSSAMLFEGKFTDVEEDEERERDRQKSAMHQGNGNRDQTVVIGGFIVDIEKQISSIDEFNQSQNSNILEIDRQIIREFLEQKKNQKDKINKEINLMYKKIQETAQLYSADVESIGLFLKNILKNFSKVFVLSKNLYAEARHLQSLNTLILMELSNWDKIQVQKNSEIEDLKAELEAERKLKLFFTQKSIKSEQRALNQENLKLSMEVRYQKQAQKIDQAIREKEELQKKLQECQKDFKQIKNDNREIKKAYESGRQKYNKIIEELSVVKETILRMNIM